jgi:hypothetical protein
MKNILLLILFITVSFSLLTADKITLKDGKILDGQLLKKTDEYLIIEVLRPNNQLHTISVMRDLVISVIDESKRVLYEKGRLKSVDLENFYQKSFLPVNFETSDQDTIVLTDGTSLIAYNIIIRGSYMSYKRLDKPSHLIFSSPLDKIESVNDKYVRIYLSEQDPYRLPEKTLTSSYPQPSIEFGVSLIHHQLNHYKNIFKEVADDLEIPENTNFRNINNPLISLNLGLDIAISQHFITAFLADFTLNFGDFEDYYEDKECFRLFLGELRYRFSVEPLIPWIGAGYAMQSITLINPYQNSQIKYKSQKNAISIAAGVEYRLIDQTGSVLIVLRYLPFGEDSLFYEYDPGIKSKSKIDLSVLQFSFSLYLNL